MAEPAAVLARLAALPETERGGVLSRVCGEDAEWRTLLELSLETGELTSDGASQGALWDVLAHDLAALERRPGALAGTRIGRIELGELIGAGGMSEVYRGHDASLDRAVAVKLLRSDRPLSAAAESRIRREARLLSRLNHPAICQIYDLGRTDNGNDYLVLELVEGRTLRELLEDGLPEGRVFAIAESVIEALVAAHAEGIIHRDLKPANIMVTGAGAVKVLDFGIARSSDGAPLRTSTIGEAQQLSALDLTSQGTILGTIAYMSPEQARGEPVTEASDIYSLGLLLQELFTGRRPYEAGLDRPALLERATRGDSRSIEGLSPDLSALIEEMKSPAAEERPTAAQTGERLRRVAAAPERRRSRRRRTALGAITAFLLVIALAAGWRLGAPEPLLVDGQDGRVIVLPVTNASGDPDLDWVRLGITELVGPTLDRVDGVSVLSTEAVEAALSRPDAEGWSEEELRRLARSMGADVVVEATLEADGDDLALSYATHKVDGGVSRHTLSGSEPTGLADRLAFRLAQRLRPGAEPPRLQDTFSDDPLVNRLYAMGKDLLDREGPALARAYFEVCLREEPNFSWARLRAAQVEIRTGERDLGRDALEVLLDQPQLEPRIRIETELELAAQDGARGDYPSSNLRFASARALAREIADVSREFGVLLLWGQFRLGIEEDAADLLHQAFELAEELGDERGRAQALNGLGAGARARGELERSREAHEQALEIATRLRDPLLRASAEHGLGKVAIYQNRPEDALVFASRSVDAYRAAGHEHFRMDALNSLGLIHFQMKSYDEAQVALEEVLELANDLDNEEFRANAANNLALIHLSRRQLDEAERYFEIVEEVEWIREGAIYQFNRAVLTYEHGRYRDALRQGEASFARLSAEMQELIAPFLEAFRRALATGERVPLPTDPPPEPRH